MPSRFQISQAVNVIQNGGVIAYATEAVYGLGCDPDNVHAIERILELKGRNAKQGFILIAAQTSQVKKYLGDLSTQESQALESDWPNPTTLILPANNLASNILTGGRDTIAVRITKHAATVKLCNALEQPLISTSANLSGRPAICRLWQLEKTFPNQNPFFIFHINNIYEHN